MISVWRLIIGLLRRIAGLVESCLVLLECRGLSIRLLRRDSLLLIGGLRIGLLLCVTLLIVDALRGVGLIILIKTLLAAVEKRLARSEVSHDSRRQSDKLWFSSFDQYTPVRKRP